MNESDWQFITFEQAKKMRQHLLIGYADFEKADRPNRVSILAEPRAIMENWFNNGVRYDDRLADPLLREILAPLRIKIYTNLPIELPSLLKVAAGEIVVAILKWRGVDEDLWGRAIRLFHPVTLGPGRELKAVFLQPARCFPSFGKVFETEGKQPKERAEIVSNNWYDIQCNYLYPTLSRLAAKCEGDLYVSDNWRAVMYNIEKRFDQMQRLKDLGWSDRERLAYHNYNEFELQEIADIESGLGNPMTAEAVRKMIKRKMPDKPRKRRL